jgi:hypothetical protein
MLKDGNLPPRPGSEESNTGVDFNHATNKIIVEINGEREEVSIIEGVRLANRILSMIEVVLVNDA